MGIDTLFDLTQNLDKSPNAFNFFVAYSCSIWNRIRFVWERLGMRIYETTITQNLIFDLVLQEKLEKFPIKILESKDEKTNGCDMEIFIETHEGFYLIACQAKLIRKNLKYPTIKHEINGKQQIDLLIDYANRKKGIPAYMLYNYCYDFEFNIEIEERTGIKPDCFGCTIANAHFIKEMCFNKNTKSGWIIPSFAMLHTPHAIPIQYLVPTHIQEEYLRSILYPGKRGLGLYSLNEILDRDNWKDAIPRAAIGDIMMDDTDLRTKELKENAPHRFNPKFRIIFPLNKMKKSRVGLFYVS